LEDKITKTVLVKYDPIIGAYSLGIPWVPTPTEIMKRKAILDMIDSCTPGSVLEIGCGSGALIYDLALKTFWGKGIDTSIEALTIARALTQSCARNFRLDSEIDETDKKSYDYVFSIAVLEHIKEDGDALRQWGECLKPNGILVLAVPAHQKLWGRNDELSGHYRRYEHYDLIRLVNNAGFSVISSYSYGYPAINILKSINKWISEIKAYRKRRKRIRVTKSEGTAKSGIDRRIWQKLFGLYSGYLFKYLWKILFSLQRKYYGSDKGTGYVLMAKLKLIPIMILLDLSHFCFEIPIT
jgi:SAM-dependent methyltransferase